MKYEIKCNAPHFECHRLYSQDSTAKRGFFSLQHKFEAHGYDVKTFFRSSPLRGQIQVEIDGFYYYVELFKSK